jgi:hypothetical protein
MALRGPSSNVSLHCSHLTGSDPPAIFFSGKNKVTFSQSTLFDLEEGSGVQLGNFVDMAQIHTMQNPKNGTNIK